MDTRHDCSCVVAADDTEHPRNLNAVVEVTFDREGVATNLHGGAAASPARAAV